jgi:hypothetical protein
MQKRACSGLRFEQRPQGIVTATYYSGETAPCARDAFHRHNAALAHPAIAAPRPSAACGLTLCHTQPVNTDAGIALTPTVK